MPFYRSVSMMNNTQKRPQTKTKLSIQQILQKPWVREHAKPIVVLLILMFGLIRPFIVEAYRIPSGSMEDTLLVGDQILVCKFIYGVKIPGTNIKVFDFHKPARGDVFVFIPSHDERHFIKRIVAIEGDTVETRGDTLYVNGQAIDDSDYTKHLRFSRHFRRDFSPFTVPKDMVFAMGDNRDQSSDSRFWGPVAVDNIKGQAFMVMFSIDNRPAKLWEVWKMVGNVRFNRIGKLIRSEQDSFKVN